MKEIFDQYVETSFDGYQQSDIKKEQFQFNYWPYFKSKTSPKALDIGVGRGEMLTCLKKWGANYQGIDISPSTVKFCQSIHLNCLQTDDTSEWLNRHQGEFDVITCLDVLEHFQKEQTIEFLTAMRLSLRKDGFVIIQVPNLQSPFGYIHHFNDFTHMSGFVEHSLSQVLLTAGFKNVQFCGFEENIGGNPKSKFRRFLRGLLWRFVKLLRAINGNPNPNILDPVFYAVAR